MANKKRIWITGSATHYDSDQERYYTHVGEDNKEMTLRYSVYAKTAEQSRKEADRMVKILSAGVR